MLRRLLLVLWIAPVVVAACTPPVEDCYTEGDEDGNGYADCLDETCWVPETGCPERCDTPFDEDGDGTFGCRDDDCWVEGGICKEICESGFDEDGDGGADCEDSECWVLNGFCSENCETDNDEDGDGFPGCMDEECWYEGGPCPELCTGLNDEDVDGLVDCEDDDCFDDEACIPTFTNDVRPILLLRCGKSGCHIGDTAAGVMSVQLYSDMLVPAYYPPCVMRSMTKGACSLYRILELSMPSDGTTVPQDEVDIIQRWVDAGIPE